jgi:hypothetical protein
MILRQQNSSQLVISDLMSPEFQAALDSKMFSFREWSSSRAFDSCRLVQYCGHDFCSAIDVSLEDIEDQISGLFCEGFYVDWAQSHECVVLRVWEYGGPEPKWVDVFAETPILTYR